jgi:K+-sensing histidine kinase KdpD
MKSPKIYCALIDDRPSLMEYLKNIGALVSAPADADIILTDSEQNLQKGVLCFLIGDKAGSGFIPIAADASCQAFYQKMLQTYSACINVLEKPNIDNGTEQVIVAGFARHFSHNVLNALLSAGGFLRQLKSQSDKNEHTYTLWKTVDDKLRFIEELVNGYNDYNHVISLQMTENIDIACYYHDLITAISDKTFDKAFSAYLSYQTNNYELSYKLDFDTVYMLPSNPFFLKLAFCYILKDTIRYLSADAAIKFDVRTMARDGKFIMEILVEDTYLQPEIMETMFKPWSHQMFTQSFDHWGIVIAQTIIAKHGGKMSATNTEKDLVYTIEL